MLTAPPPPIPVLVVFSLGGGVAGNNVSTRGSRIRLMHNESSLMRYLRHATALPRTPASSGISLCADVSVQADSHHRDGDGRRWRRYERARRRSEHAAGA